MFAHAAEDDHKRRARQRLIGAIALTVLAVAILPLVLHEPKAPVANLQVHMPATAPLPNTIQYADPPGLPPEPAQDQLPSAPPAPQAEVGPATVAPPDTNALEARAPVNKATEQNATPTAASKPASEAAASSAKSVPEATPKPTSKEVNLVVQAGVFGDPVNADKQKRRIESLGYAVRLDQVNGGTRVRATGFSSREEATKAAEKLKAAGVKEARVIVP